MKELYIDFDGVIMNTIEVTYLELKEMNLDSKNENDQEQIRDYYTNIDWHMLLNEKANVINDAIDCIKELNNSDKFNVSILTHVNSLTEAIEKIDYLREYLNSVTIIPVPRDIAKTKMVNPSNAILVDDYIGNLKDWESCGGISVKFDTDLDGKGYKVIDRLDKLFDLDL